MGRSGEKGFFLLFTLLLVVSFVSAENFDVISNGGEWFVCDASGNAPNPLGGLNDANYVDEYGTFGSRTVDNKPACLDTIADFPPPWGDIHDCESSTFLGCPDVEYPKCVRDSGELITHSYNFDSFRNTCGDVCKDGEGDEDTLFNYLTDGSNAATICELFPALCLTNDIVIEEGVFIVPKRQCGVTFDSCMDTVQVGSCLYITGSNDRICDEFSYCNGGVFIYSDEPPDNIYQTPACCFGEEAGCKQLTVDECVLKGGVLGNPTELFCSGKEVVLDSIDDNCCFNGEWLPDLTKLYFDSYLASPDKFVCYEGSYGSSFAECCGDGLACENLNSPLQRYDQYKYFAVGSTFHSLKNFDGLADDDEYAYIDKVRIYKNLQASDAENGKKIHLEQKNWGGFDFFVMDIAYNLPGYIGNITFKTSDGNYERSYPIVNHSRNGKNPFRWHRIVIELDDPTNFNGYSDMDSPRIHYVPLETNALDMVIDNLHLYSDDGGDVDKSKNQYCSGNWGKWVSNLDGDSDEGFNSSSNIEEKGPYHAACEAQGPFDWTGFRCCGDDTWPESYGEFFNDINHGCYNGTTVYHDWTYANATNDNSNKNKDLLFYDGTFWVCDHQGAYQHYETVKQSFDGDISETNLSSNLSTLFEARGSWYCDPAEGWEYLRDANRLKIIAATFLDMADSDDTYTLHCGDENTVMNIPESPYADAYPYADTDNYCVLVRSNGAVIIGTGVPKRNVSDFLNKNLESFHPFKEDGEDGYNCEFGAETVFDDSSFYRPCGKVSDWLNASYNPHFGILIFSLKDPEQASGIFGFFVNMWKGIVTFFQNLFLGPEEELAMRVPTNINSSSFNELYVKHSSTKEIYGVREADTIVIFYEGFTNVSFLQNLTEQWFEKNKENADDKFDIDLSIGVNNAILKINGTDKNLINKKFPWEFLTSNLKFD
ncbi:hypothetical protein HQ533_01710 [Candidatus Woesearchaeota archaeon]|nr:hypothetical protein [Candidatus Woesearchaeota archaeon]